MPLLSDYQALLFDLDGTLTNEKRELSPETITTLQKLAETHIVGVCTGRAYVTISKKILPFFPASSIHVLSGGARVVNQSGEVLFDQSIPIETVKKIYPELAKLGGYFLFQGTDCLYPSAEIFENVKNHYWQFPVKPLEEMNADIPLFSVYNVTKDITDYLLNTPEISFKNISFVERADYYDITAAGVNKSIGLSAWSNITGIPLEKVIGFGDGDNDTEFLQTVGFGIAKSHAPENLKRMADKVLTSEYDNLGVYLEYILKGNEL